MLTCGCENVLPSLNHHVRDATSLRTVLNALSRQVEVSRNVLGGRVGGYEGKPAPLDLVQSMFSRGNVDR